MKKLLALLMTMCLLALPLAALAEEIAYKNFALTVSDPYFEVGATGADKPMTVVDLTGLSLGLEGTVEEGMLAMVAHLTANGTNALSGSLLIDALGANAALSGMQHSITIPAEMLAQQGFSVENLMGSEDSNPLGKITALVGTVEMVEAGREEVEFYGGGKLPANKQTFTISKDQFTEIFKAMNLTMDETPEISADATVWIDDSEAHVRAEVVYHLAMGDEMNDLTLIMQAYAPEENTAFLKLNMDGAHGIAMNGDYMVTPSTVVDGSVNVFCDLTMTVEDEAVKLQLVGWPEAKEDGTAYTLQLTVGDGITDVRMGATALTNDASARYALTVNAPGNTSLTLKYDAQKTEGGMDGVLAFSMIDNYETVNARIGLGFNGSGDVIEPRLAGYEPIDVSNLTQDDIDTLGTEAQTVLMQALGALMQVPGVQTLILGNMY